MFLICLPKIGNWLKTKKRKKIRNSYFVFELAVKFVLPP